MAASALSYRIFSNGCTMGVPGKLGMPLKLKTKLSAINTN